MHSLAGIAHPTTDRLVTRAADVCLKERRRLVLLFREAPLHAGHIRAMAAATKNGAIVFPPAPAFYDRPSSVEDYGEGRSWILAGYTSIDASRRKWTKGGDYE